MQFLPAGILQTNGVDHAVYPPQSGYRSRTVSCLIDRSDQSRDDYPI